MGLSGANELSGKVTEAEHPFTYLEGTANGPNKWGLIKPEWQACGAGKLQSPIDLVREKVQIFPNLGNLEKDYKPAAAKLRNRGHDISLQWEGDAGKLSINGTQYNLQQCHWHTPSEHTLNGKRYDMELHVVHKNPQEQIAVIGMLFEFGPPDTFLHKMIPHVKGIGEEGIDLEIINPGEIIFGGKKYYRYIGSLTVPPCTEGVTWTVMKKIRTVSREQVAALRAAVPDGFKVNSRPTQELHGRPVFFYNSAGGVGRKGPKLTSKESGMHGS